MNESPEGDARELFLQQLIGDAKQNFSQPAISDDDEGDLAFLIAADPGAGIIRIKFAKPVVAIGFEPDDARNFASVLLEKVRELQPAAVGSPLFADWIHDRMPDEGVTVLCIWSGECIHTAQRHGGMWHVPNCQSDMYDKPVGWLPLGMLPISNEN